MRLTPKSYVLEPGDEVLVYDAVPVYSSDDGVLLYTRHTITLRGTLTDTNDDGGTRGPLPNER